MTPHPQAAPPLLFVCIGNICRSPTAEGVMRHRLEAEGLPDPYFGGEHGLAHVFDVVDAAHAEVAPLADGHAERVGVFSTSRSSCTPSCSL